MQAIMHVLQRDIQACADDMLCAQGVGSKVQRPGGAAAQHLRPDSKPGVCALITNHSACIAAGTTVYAQVARMLEIVDLQKIDTYIFLHMYLYFYRQLAKIRRIFLRVYEYAVFWNLCYRTSDDAINDFFFCVFMYTCTFIYLCVISGYV